MSILEDRYPSQEMRDNFSKERKVRGWRDCWIALAEAEKELGLDIKPEQIAEMRAKRDNIDFKRAAELEKQTKHDVMAHILHYGEQCPKAKPIIHLGATSAYVCDNTELLQMKDALILVRDKTVKCIDLNAKNAMKYKDFPCLGYTHLQPAQPTTLGKRMSLWAQELYMAFIDIECRLNNFKGRGVKGTTGTQDSFLKLFNDDESKVKELDRRVAEKLGFDSTYPVTGQTYPRLFDYQVLSSLADIAVAAGKTGGDLRLMQHMKEVEEPFGKKQVGSSAMPYKRNPIRSERMCSLARNLIVDSLKPAITASEQIFERTLDDSAIRKIYIPDAFYSTDAILELYMFLMDGLVVYPKMMEEHLQEELPFMVTEKILMEAVKRGGNRQTLHKRIEKYAMEAGKKIKEEGLDNNLLERLAQDPKIPLNKNEIYAMVGDHLSFTGRAVSQVKEFVNNYVKPLRSRYPDALKIKPGVEI